MYKKSPENRMAKNGDMIKEMSNFLPFWHFKENVKKRNI